jgi:hypothetical protein
MGPRVCQLLVTLCVTLSLTLFALGDADLTSGFCLKTLSFSRPTTIVGPILDIVVISHAMEGPVHEELGACKHIRRTLMHYAKSHCLATSAGTPWAMRMNDGPCAP